MTYPLTTSVVTTLNHFVEIGTNGNDTLITVHSGSRSVGGSVFRSCKNKAKDYNKAKSKEEIKEEINKRKQNIPNEDIPALIEQIHKDNKRDLLPSIPMEQVKHMYVSADRYAKRSREEIITNVMSALKDIDAHAPDAYQLLVCTHNYIDFSEEIPVVRKGSIKATEGTDVIIPLNMRDGIIIGKAVNTDKLNNSLPHGAGRKKSRTAFRKEFSMEEYEKEMVGIIAPSLSEATLDEAPSAYKDADTIIEDIAIHIEDMRIFKPVFNYKGE